MEKGKAPLEPGEILAGKYRVLFVIGEGGMGHVLAAEHVQLGHRVALKVMRRSALSSAEAVERFVREGRAAARLQSEHVARVSDVGTLDSGAPYLVMELLEGEDLADVLRVRPQLPIAEAVDYAIQAGEALAEAHRHGIVHRDVKPANLFITTSLDGAPLVKVLDFGISKASQGVEAEAPQITSLTAMIGSPKYMSPEQMEDSSAVDGRADIWALGAILYEMLAGRRAFDATTLATTCVQILKEDPPPVRASRPEVPRALDAIVMRCLQKNPADRFATVADLALALAPFAPGAAKVVTRIRRTTSGADALSPAPVSSRAPTTVSAPVVSVSTLVSGSRRLLTDSQGRVAPSSPGNSRSLVAAVVGTVTVLLALGVSSYGVSKGPATPASAIATKPIERFTVTPPVSVVERVDVLLGEGASAPIETSAPREAGARASSPHLPPRPPSTTDLPGVSDRVLEDRR